MFLTHYVYFCSRRFWHSTFSTDPGLLWADLEGGQGVRTTPSPEKSQTLTVSKQYWSESPENHKATKPAFNVEHLNGVWLAGQWWPAYSGILILSPLIKKKKRCQSWTPSGITFWIRAWLYYKESYSFEKICISVFSIRTSVTLRMQKASSRFWLNNFPWWILLSVGITWDLWLHRNEARAYCRTTTA